MNDIKILSSDGCIVSNPQILVGKPTVVGTRISVAQVLGYLAEGMTPEEIVEQLPTLRRRDVLSCIAYASEVIEKRQRSRKAA